MFFSLILFLWFVTSQNPKSFIGTWDKPPKLVPSQGRWVDGPLLGNGDSGAVLGGSKTNLTFYLNKNDNWFLHLGEGFIAGLGLINFDLTSFTQKSKNYELTQDAKNGFIYFNMGSIRGNATILQDYSSNIMFISFNNVSNSEILVNITCQPSSNLWNTSYGKQNDVQYCYREGIASDIVNVVSLIAYESINYNNNAIFIISLVSNFNVMSTNIATIIHNATESIKTFVKNPTLIDTELNNNAKFFNNFWSKTSIDLPNEELIESYYYKNLYIALMSNRENNFAPGLWSVWVTQDGQFWAGDYTLNYNFESVYYGLYSGNHVELISPYYETIIEYQRKGFASNDAEALGCPNSVHYPGHLQPLGYSNSGTMGQHSDASFAGINFVTHYKYTQDDTFLTKNNYEYYYFLSNISNWWLCWTNISYNSTDILVDGKDCTRENCGKDKSNDVNPAISLEFSKYIIEFLIEITPKLGITNHLFTHWINYISKISPIPTGIHDNEEVFLPQQVPYYYKIADNPLQLYAIHPGNQIGLGSTAVMLKIAHNTIRQSESWNQGNAFPEIYPAAIRTGYDIDLTLFELKKHLTEKMPASGYVQNGGGGIETCGALMAINEMLLMSWDGVLRFFSVYNKDSASFQGLRAIGAFVVDAKMINGKIESPINVFSEKGRLCEFDVPKGWNSDTMKVCVGDGSGCDKSVPLKCGIYCKFNTTVNEMYRLVQE